MDYFKPRQKIMKEPCEVLTLMTSTCESQMIAKAETLWPADDWVVCLAKDSTIGNLTDRGWRIALRAGNDDDEMYSMSFCQIRNDSQ